MRALKRTLDFKDGFLCVPTESETFGGSRNITRAREWHQVHATEMEEVGTLIGRPVIEVSSDEGIYVDEDGNVF